MIVAINFFFFLAGMFVAIPSVVFFVETLAAFASRATGKPMVEESLYRPIAVLVPAHNESSGVGPTLDNILQQLSGSDMLLVIADNCTDDTAAIASAHGAEVIVRNNTSRRGKGFALAYGLDYLEPRQPRVVIIIDADCRVEPGTIRKLAATCATWRRPVQALNLMKSPTGQKHRFAMAEFAWIIRNKIRPLGLANLGLPCQLMGTGMAFPWAIIRSANLASSNVVEDLELGLTLTRNGLPPKFCVEALVESQFPMTEEGAIEQRKRWEQGSLVMLLRDGLRTLFEALRQGNVPLLALALDMMVPPLALHAAAVVLLSSIIGVSYLVGATEFLMFAFVISSGVLLVVSLLLSWYGFGRDALPFDQWHTLAPYLLAKLKIYRGFGGRGPKEWVRTDRSKEK